MFTGLIEEVGKVRSVSTREENRVLEIEAKLAAGLAAGDSVAVNGCCLTVVGMAERSFKAEAVAATLEATDLGALRSGSRVNLERAMAAGGRFGGHLVQGHVDGVAKVARIERQSGSWQLGIRVGPENLRFLVEHGSVAVEGVSLTIAGLLPDGFSVNVIPHTWEHTNFPELRAGDRVNIEYDLIVRAVDRLLGSHGRL